MTNEELNIEFEDAVERINNFKEPFPADFLLRLYAYYKKAINDTITSSLYPKMNQCGICNPENLLETKIKFKLTRIQIAKK